MDLYLLRHGKAELRSPAIPEAARALTAEGREDVRRVIKFARVVPDAILSSPYVRARQTADIAARLMGVKVSESRNLLPEARATDLWTELLGFGDTEAILLTGHEPHLSSFIGLLTGGRIEMKKSGLACVRVNPAKVPNGTLRWFVAPSLLR